MKRLLYKRPDGSIRVIIPVNPNKSLAEIKADFERKDPAMADCTYIGEIDASELPPREFRDCWRYDGKKVHVVPALEAEVRWKRIRAERDKLLKDSDGMMTRALEMNKDVEAWKSYRQALRDIPTQPDPKSIVWPTKPQ